MFDVVREPINDEKEELQIWQPANFCRFGLEHALARNPNFETFPLNANVVRRRWNDHSSSYLPVLEYTDVNHCEFVFKRPS